MNIVLKSISHEEKVSKGGKNWTSCKLVVPRKDGGKDTWITGFGSDITKTWKAGDTVDVDVAQDEKGYWGFKENANSLPSKDPILTVLEQIRDLLAGKAKPVYPEKPTPFQNDVEDITKKFNEETPDFLK